MDQNYLIVAADGQVRQALAEELRREGRNVTLASSGAEAKRVVDSLAVGCVLLETHLQDVNAEELRTQLLEIRPDCRVIVLSSFQLVRNSPELLRFGREDYLVRAGQLFELLRGGGESEEDWTALWDEPGTDALLKVIDVLVGLLELEHRSFFGSSHQAMQLARATAEELGAIDSLIYEVMLGTLLRDVGRAGLGHAPDEELSEEDRNEQDRAHVSSSLRLFEHIEFPWKVLPVVRHHHERYDGTGAPDGLRGREIPMGARIVAVVDAYVAMTSRAGENASPEKALDQLVCDTGHAFDPEVVEAFHRVMDKRLGTRAGTGKPEVLIVESDSDFRRLLKMRLLNEGMEVREADSYEACLERLLKEPPDLALIDVDTDPSEAFQLLQEMQQDERLCRIPLAFLSHRADRVLRIRALRQGVDDFLVKGEDTEELVARVLNIVVREAVRAEGEQRRKRRGISGSLANLSLPDIIQTLTIGMKTACVSLSCDDREGTIWFDSGAPTHAEAGELKGDKAFYEMVRWTGGEFVIEHGAKTKRKSIEQDAMFLLMEGLRLMDEEGCDEPCSAS